MGYSLCCLCAGLLSPEFRQQNPGAFNILFGVYGGCWSKAGWCQV